jgi:MFS family permease
VTMRFGARNTLIPALVLLVAGLALFARAPVDGDYLADVLAPVLLVGVGAGLAFPSLMQLAMSGATHADAGLASGLINTTAQVGGALGLAVLATLSTTRTETLLDEGRSTASALTSGYHLAFVIGAALVIVGVVLAATVLKPESVAAREVSGRDSDAAFEQA